MISICTPTRGRPESFKKMCLSVLENASNLNDIEFVVYRDNDDESAYEYVGNHKEIRGERLYADPTYNMCQKVATGPIYMFVPDDIIFETKDWDEQVKNVFDKFADKIIAVYFDNGTGFAFGVGCLHKNWIDTVGYFLNPDLCRRGDVWISRIAKNLNRRVFLRRVVYKDQNITEDQTHAEYLMEYERTNCYEQYHKMRPIRSRDQALLQTFIDNYNK